MPRLYFWRGRALYIGPVSDVDVHAHHAVQAALALDSPFEFGVDGRTLRARAVLVDSDRPHRLDSLGEDAAVFLLESESRDAERLRRGGMESEGFRVMNDDRAATLAGELAALMEQPAGCDPAGRCFDRLIEAWGAAPAPPVQRDERIDRALAAIQGLAEKKISLADLAAQAHLSESRFIHLFTEQVGVAPRRYLLWTRLMDAVQAALSGDSLTAAAHKAGFADSAHLSRTFKSMFGLPPSHLFAPGKNSRFVQAVFCRD